MAVLSWWSDLSLLDCGNERDLRILNSHAHPRVCRGLLRWTLCVKHTEVGGNNRSVMPLDVLGCTRATLMPSPSRPLSRQGWGIF